MQRPINSFAATLFGISIAVSTAVPAHSSPTDMLGTIDSHMSLYSEPFGPDMTSHYTLTSSSPLPWLSDNGAYTVEMTLAANEVELPEEPAQPDTSDSSDDTVDAQEMELGFDASFNDSEMDDFRGTNNPISINDLGKTTANIVTEVDGNNVIIGGGGLNPANKIGDGALSGNRGITNTYILNGALNTVNANTQVDVTIINM